VHNNILLNLRALIKWKRIGLWRLWRQNLPFRAGGVTQVVEPLPSKPSKSDTLSSSPRTKK
jgi:hypothetical protein